MKIATIPGIHSKAQQQANNIVKMLKQVCEYKGVGVVFNHTDNTVDIVVGVVDSNNHNAMVSAVKAYVYSKKWVGIACLDTDAKWCYIR